MSVAIWFMLGFVIGWIADNLMPGKSGRMPILPITLGICGALFGGWLGVQLGYGTTVEVDFGSLMTALAGAYFVVATFRLACQSK